MIKYIIKTAAIGCLCVPMMIFSNGLEVRAESSSYKDSGEPVAGISVALSNYYATAANPNEDLKAYLSPLGLRMLSAPLGALSDSEDKSLEAEDSSEPEEPEERSEEEEAVVSPYANVAISRVSNYVNVRSTPDTEGEILGKIYNNCAATILESVDGEDGEWYNIKSGSVTGYIKAEYFITGEEAEKVAKEVGEVIATVVNTATLRLREEANLDSTTLTLLAEDSEYIVLSEEDEFAKIQVDNDLVGYASKEFLDIRVEFQKAISIEEEEAKKAEEARLKREAEEAIKKAKAANKKSTKASAPAPAAAAPGQTAAPAPAAPPVNLGDASATRQAVVAYAMQFLGNPYRYGGTSLTNGADCSGFTSSIYSNFGVSTGRSSRDQASRGRSISVESAQPGDLIFYSSGGTINHVAMSIGNGQVIHASTAQTGIKISNMYYRTPCKAVSFLD